MMTLILSYTIAPPGRNPYQARKLSRVSPNFHTIQSTRQQCLTCGHSYETALVCVQRSDTVFAGRYLSSMFQTWKKYLSDVVHLALENHIDV